MRNTFSTSTLLRAGRLFVLTLLPALALALSGCGEPVAIYHAPSAYLAQGRSVLVLPFMDTRTFVDERDKHREDLGNHVRDIFVTSIEGYTAGMDLKILTPAMEAPTRSMTNAEVAELGRDHGADVVVAGQVFSFTDTRAASIPPRAGMFVRVISARDGSLLFVGDHYQAAAVPGAPGGREQQAANVANRLVEGFLDKARPMLQSAGRVASSAALAYLAPPLAPLLPVANAAGGTDPAVEGASLTDPRPLPGLSGSTLLNPEEWDEQVIPEIPPLLDLADDFYQSPVPAPAAPAQPADAPRPEELAPLVAPARTEAPAQPETVVTIAGSPAPAGEAGPDSAVPIVSEVLDDAGMLAVMEMAEFPLPLDEAILGAETDAVEGGTAVGVPETAYPEEQDGISRLPDPGSPPSGAADEPGHVAGVEAREIDELPEIDLGSLDRELLEEERRAIADAAAMSGDDLAADLFDSEDGMIRSAARERRRPARVAEAALNGVPGTVVPQAATGDVPVRTPAGDSHYGPFEFDPDTLEVRNPLPRDLSTRSAPGALPGRDEISDAGYDPGGPVFSTPLVSEQPRTYRGADVVELPADPALASLDDTALVSAPMRTARPDAVRLLILPYHDRPNTNNLIDNTGGGEVVTTLYGTQLALDPRIQLMWDASGQASHHQLLSREEAVRMGRLAGADYVIRGQVVEFRRAQSVPSFYSAVISTAVLAAQMVFAEMSGVDVATEVYRVADGLCVLSRRDRSQQKYVVQAEKTVRRMAVPMAESVSLVVRGAAPGPMDPVIDGLMPETAMMR